MEGPDVAALWANGGPEQGLSGVNDSPGLRTGLTGEDEGRDDDEGDDDDEVADDGFAKSADDHPPELYEAVEAAAGSISFFDICKRLEDCRCRTGGKKADRLAILFDKTIREQIHARARPEGVSLFPIIRLLCPEEDHRAGKFRLKGSTVCDIYIRILGLGSSDSQRLKEYRDPKKNAVLADSAVELGEPLMAILKDRVRKEPSGLTVQQVNTDILDKLVNGRGSEKRRLSEQADFFRTHVIERMNWLEQVWLVRIIIHETKRCGITSNVAIGFLGENALQSFSMKKYLRKICADFAREEVAASGPTLGVPLEPMRADKATSHIKVEQQMKGGAFLMERKLDGHRLHVHKMGDKFKFITRSMKNQTDHVRDKEKQDKYTKLEPVLKTNVKVEKCILDGELMAWDVDHDEFISFAHICSTHLNRNEYVYVVFDLLYIDGKGAAEAFQKAGVQPCKPQELKDRPLEERRRLLKAVVEEKEKRLEMVECEEVRERDTTRRQEAIHRYYERALDENWEGLLIKSLSSPYETKRSKSWYKLKPDYQDDTQDLDVLILGGYFREGRLWTNRPSRFLVGVAADTAELEVKTDAAGRVIPPRWYSFAKVASGLKTEQREKLEEKLAPHWFEVEEGGRLPDYFMFWNPGKDDRPARFIRPEHSVVITVKAAELVVTTSFSLKWTLRNPRITSIRDDKAPADALDFKGFQDARNNFRKKREKGGAAGRKGMSSSLDRAAKRRGIRVAEGHRLNVKRVDNIESEVFKGVKLRVLPFDQYTSDLDYATELLFPQDKGKRPAGSKLRVTHNDVIGLVLRHGAMAEDVGTVLPKYDKEAASGSCGKKRKRPSASELYIVGPSGRCHQVMNIVQGQRKKGGLQHDIVSLDWLLECVYNGRFEKPRAVHLYHRTEDTERRLRRLYDRYNDSYVDRIDADELGRLLARMEREEDEEADEWRDVATRHLVTAEEMDCLDGAANLFWGRGFVFYVDCYTTLGPASASRQPIVSSLLSPLLARLRLQGAKVSEQLDQSVSVVIVDRADRTRFAQMVRMERRIRSRTWHSTRQWMVVDRAWVERCVAENEMTLADDDTKVHLPTLLREAGEHAETTAEEETEMDDEAWFLGEHEE